MVRAVREGPEWRRWKMGKPSSSSRFCKPSDSVGWEMYRLAAAWLNEPCFTTAKSELGDMFEAQMEQFRKELGAKDALHFSGWSIGHDSAKFDHLLSDAERQLLDQ